jgi:putative ABC transport system permease protein
MSDFLLGIKITIKDLLSRKGRSFLTILGVVIGVAGVIIIISLGAGAQSLVVGQITKLGNNLVGVLPGKSNEKGPPSFVFGIQIKTLSNRDLDSLRDKNKIPNITAVAPVVSGVVTVIYNKDSVDTNFVGTDEGYPLVQNIEMEKGSFFSKGDIESRENIAILGKDVSDVLFPNGDEIGKIIKVKSINSETSGVPFRVIGVQKKMGNVGFQNQDDKIFIPLSIAQNQILGIDYLQSIYIKINAEENVLSSMEEIRNTLRENHRIKDPVNDDFDVRNFSDAIKMITSITDILRIFLGLMAGISLVVGGIGIMNIMLVTVSERTREIGLRKAIGATSKKIRNQFLTEAVILTLTGGIIGIALGVLISYLIAVVARFAGYDWSFIISPFSIILAVSVSVLTGIIFGIYPALKASKLDPIEALRYE